MNQRFCLHVIGDKRKAERESVWKTMRSKDRGRGSQHCLSQLWGQVMSVWSHYPALSPRTNSQWPPSSPPSLHPPYSLHPLLTTSTAHVLTTCLAHLLSNDCHSLYPLLQIPFISTIAGSHSDHSVPNALGERTGEWDRMSASGKVRQREPPFDTRHMWRVSLSGVVIHLTLKIVLGSFPPFSALQ